MKKLSILVLSCDKYSSLWGMFFSRFEKFWPDCPYRLFLLTNKLDYECDRVTTIRTGEDIDWSSNLLFALDRIDSDDILLMMEDAPLDQSIEQCKFNDLYEKFCSEGMDFLNLKAMPKPQGGKESICIIPPGAHYRASLVPNLWSKEVLKNIALPGETAWQFEIYGSVRSDKYERFYTLSKPFIKTLHCVIQGKIDLRALNRLGDDLIKYNITLPVMSLSQFLTVRMLEIRSEIYNRITPYGLRRWGRNLWYKYIVKKGNLL